MSTLRTRASDFSVRADEPRARVLPVVLRERRVDELPQRAFCVRRQRNTI